MADTEQSTPKGKRILGLRRTFTYEHFLFLSFITAVSVLTYESLTQKYFTEGSILKMLHNAGLFLKYAIIYEPSKGIWHDIGWTGSFMMVIMMIYSIRKRVGFLSNFGSLRYWLWAHMFLGIMGPVLVTFHTTFKFVGIIATSFWCMIVTMIFGILGRYIYVQIPRSLSGAELQVGDIDMELQALDNEIKTLSKGNIPGLMKLMGNVDDKVEDISPLETLRIMVKSDVTNRIHVRQIKKQLKKEYHLDHGVRKAIASRLKERALFMRRKRFLATSHKLLHYWHVFHVPLAVVMFIIMFLHIVVYFIFTPSH